MTVGISLTNGLEAVVITDSRVSGLGRQSDSVNKLATFLEDNYHGALFGTGSGNIIELLFKSLSETSGEHLEDFVQELKKPLQDWTHLADQDWLENQRRDIEEAASLIQESDARGKYVKKGIKQVQDKYMRAKHDSDRQVTEFVLVAFDKEAKRIRSFGVSEQGSVPWESAHIEIGSGRDGANLYLSANLQGMDTKKLTSPQLAYLAMNAYSNSTINRGVGGTPKVALLSKRGCKVLPTRDARLLANLSGVFLSGLRHSHLPKDKLQGYISAILDKQAPYDLISRALRLDKSVLTGIYIPYSSWQERANSR